MKKYFYDLHIHSCLSPCADNDMTPENIAGMAAVCGLQIIALTDHNTCKNCRAFFTAAKKHGIVPIAGVELTTAEDVHLVCLFPTLEKAEKFDSEIQGHRVLYKNKSEIFGEQLIMDENDEVVAIEENLLINALTLDIVSLYELLQKYEASIFPAHIDREENGIISILGTLPDKPYFPCVEINKSENIDKYTKSLNLNDKLILINSDAHRLWEINEAENFIMLEDELCGLKDITEKLMHLISKK